MCYKQYIQVTVKPIYRFRFTKKPPSSTYSNTRKKIFVKQVSVKSKISAVCPLEQYVFQQKRWGLFQALAAGRAAALGQVLETICFARLPKSLTACGGVG